MTLENCYVRITFEDRVYRGKVLRAENYGSRIYIPNDPPDWYIEFRDTDPISGEVIPNSSRYLKQIIDGFGNVVIEFSDNPFLQEKTIVKKPRKQGFKYSGKEPIGTATGRNGVFDIFAIRFDVVSDQVYIEVQGITGTVLNAGLNVNIKLFAIACTKFLISQGFVVVNKEEKLWKRSKE